jgi:hypothetical protein
MNEIAATVKESDCKNPFQLFGKISSSMAAFYPAGLERGNDNACWLMAIYCCETGVRLIVRGFERSAQDS